MIYEEQYRFLSTDGIFVKRAIIVEEDYVLVGFKEPTMIACCNDGTRPVIFKIERIDD